MILCFGQNASIAKSFAMRHVKIFMLETCLAAIRCYTCLPILTCFAMCDLYMLIAFVSNIVIGAEPDAISCEAFGITTSNLNIGGCIDRIICKKMDAAAIILIHS